MQSTYKVDRIAAAQIEPAYLLVNRIAPALSPEQWRACCREIIGRKDRHSDKEDVAVATNALGYVQGLCVSAMRRHLIYGRILDVSVLAAASAADEAGVAEGILRYLRALAQTEACQAIRVWTLGQEDWIPALDDAEIECSRHNALILRDRQAPIVA